MRTETKPSKKKKRLLKSLITTVCVAVVFVILVLLFISPIAKYLIEKHDVELTGREIKIDWAYVNPFTGYVYLNNPRIYELNSDTLALTAKGISANIALSGLLSKTCNVGDLELNQPMWFIKQRGSKHDLNFKD